MARRRMFSPDIVCSDAFLDMPTSSRELYFQLGMVADDDGFVNPRKTMRMIGASDDDLKILITKRFTIPFESGVIVIKHWKISNNIRADMYKPTLYLEERKTLYTKENMAYSLDESKSRKTSRNRNIPRNVQRTIGKVRLGKVRLGKVTLPAKAGETTYSKDFLEFWERYPKKIGKGAAWSSWNKVTHPTIIDLTDAIQRQVTSLQWKRDNGQYIPNPATWLNQRRWEDETQPEANTYKVTKI